MAIFPGSTRDKEPTCQCSRHTDAGLILGWSRSPGEGNGNPLQYSCLEKPVDRVAWQVTVHRVARVGHNLATKPLQGRCQRLYEKMLNPHAVPSCSQCWWGEHLAHESDQFQARLELLPGTLDCWHAGQGLFSEAS